MKIQQLRFKNLNSLYGEWSIDFTSPEYESSGIFAIIGPTGSGKSTVLDAICLALYARTPRLKSINNSGNEIMSRQTGECFAEVTFETGAGRFTCHWSQGRARKKVDGNLLASKHEISEFEEGTPLASKKRDVALVVEEKTGMDFERFTRSMLLAQGGFAAFLQAAPDERAPILEQITGTEIYSAISIAAHERRRSERDKLDLLEAEMAGVSIFSDEDEVILTNELAVGRKEAEILGKSLKKSPKGSDPFFL
ncbi:MAG: AAA family ATPase, partial [Victivallales bacterium]|nr:AAA family ATPase [Victivallales bacterium]